MNKSKKVAVYGLFAAVIVVLQLLSYAVKIGTFNLSLVLIPVVLGAYLYGISAGAVFGAVFGVVVTVCCITGLDAGGQIMFNANPLLTAFVCIFKGAAAGFCAGLVARLLKNANGHLAIMLCAITAPIVNTLTFVLFLTFGFNDILVSWAGGGNLVSYIIFSLVGINFIIEMLINVCFAPALLSVTKALKKI